MVDRTTFTSESTSSSLIHISAIGFVQSAMVPRPD